LEVLSIKDVSFRKFVSLTSLIDSKLSSEIAREKIEEVISTGAQAVVTSCQQCVRTMTTYVRRNKVPLEILDITQLIHRALKK
jgi:heterodisulfide reductase subunit D